MKRAFVIGIVGAESSGKTQLAQALQARLVAEDWPAAMVAEALREFCDQSSPDTASTTNRRRSPSSRRAASRMPRQAMPPSSPTRRR